MTAEITNSSIKKGAAVKCGRLGSLLRLVAWLREQGGKATVREYAVHRLMTTEYVGTLFKSAANRGFVERTGEPGEWRLTEKAPKEDR